VLRLDHVQLAAPPGCEPEARRFYGKLLGLKELPKPAPLRARGGAWFSLGQHQLHIGVDQAFSPARKAHPAFEVDPEHLDAVARRLSSAGATVSWDTALPDVRRFYTEDPWGNRIELVAAPAGRDPGAQAAARSQPPPTMTLIHDRPRSVELDEFLARPLFAHLATAVDGEPRESPVWFLWEDGAIWIIGSRTTDTFPDRIEQEPRCAIGIVDFDRPTGVVQHIGFRGHATVEAFGAQRARRLLKRYLGNDEGAWDKRFLGTLADRDNDRNVLVRFAPHSAVSRDVSYGPG
jgi:catechol 2,3-dioxygenase-like lactoylglutathione lyase family enzyme